eukprot:588874-Amorphochlora_amoeboformis.AAC.1
MLVVHLHSTPLIFQHRVNRNLRASIQQVRQAWQPRVRMRRDLEEMRSPVQIKAVHLLFQLSRASEQSGSRALGAQTKVEKVVPPKK